jgi:hypothetical protein
VLTSSLVAAGSQETRLTDAKFLLILASKIIPGFESHGTHDHILLCDGLQTTHQLFVRSVKLQLAFASSHF